MREKEFVSCRMCPFWNPLCYDKIEDVPETTSAASCPVVKIYDRQPVEGGDY